jgi:hypothetical protein
MNEVGTLPEIVGNFRGECPEFMTVQYMPIWMPHFGLELPEHLKWLRPMVDVVFDDLYNTPAATKYRYVYATVKHGYVGTGCLQNRPGWHIDGYGSDDLNYIWYTNNPTEFLDQRMSLAEDHELSMLAMEQLADPENIVSYHSKLVLKLDNTVIHRVKEVFAPCLRTFVKLSVSEHKYNLKGNAHNYLFNYDWEMHERSPERNHPTK